MDHYVTRLTETKGLTCKLQLNLLNSFFINQKKMKETNEHLPQMNNSMKMM